MRIPGGPGRAVAGLYEAFLTPPGTPDVSFAEPKGEPALVPAGSVSWTVFSNPVTLFVGGVLAVILELALPKVRHGVWDHSSFRTDPKLRLQRTGLAAMTTIYAARSVSLPMIESVNRRHRAVAGRTDKGEAYRADEADLLTWVHATAAFGFARAYSHLAEPLSQAQWGAFFQEGAPVAEAYGATGVPRSQAQWRALLDSRAPQLEGSAAIEAFLTIMTKTPVLPLIARPLQAPLVRTARSLVPQRLDGALALPHRFDLRPGDRLLTRTAAAAASRLEVESSPAVLACRRVGRDPARLRRLPPVQRG